MVVHFELEKTKYILKPKSAWQFDASLVFCFKKNHLIRIEINFFQIKKFPKNEKKILSRVKASSWHCLPHQTWPDSDIPICFRFEIRIFWPNRSRPGPVSSLELEPGRRFHATRGCGAADPRRSASIAENGNSINFCNFLEQNFNLKDESVLYCVKFVMIR